MASRLVLLGAKIGAWCAIDTVRHPVLKIDGLSDGVVDFEVLTEDREKLLGGVSTDGVYDLHEWFSSVRGERQLSWIRVSATKPTPSLVCLVIPKKAA